MMKKKLLNLFLLFILIVVFIPCIASANEYYDENDDLSFTVNGVHLPIEGYEPGKPWDNCWTFANIICEKIWGTSDEEDLLRDIRSKDDLKITATNTKRYIQAAELGAHIRVDAGDDTYMHSLVLVDKDDKGFTVYQGNFNSAIYFTYYTYEGFAEDFENYKYFDYITYPNAKAYKYVDDGICGDNSTWILDNAGTLIISGTGEMYNYSPADNPPSWHNYKDKIKRVFIEDGITSVGEYAFSSYPLTDVSLAYSVTDIGICAFNYSGLENIELSDNITHIGSDAFYGSAYYRNSDNYENGALYIGNNLIYATTNIVSPDSAVNFEVREGTLCIADYAFNSFVANVYIPDSVINIGEGAFSQAYRLTNIAVDENNRYYCSENGNCFNKDKTTLIRYSPKKDELKYEIPKGVKEIAKYAFNNCDKLQNITIPNTVTYINDYAFNGVTSLTSLHIPESVKYIGDGAIDWCDKLKEIYIEKGVEVIKNLAWMSSNLKIIYYSGSKYDWENISITDDYGWLKNVIVYPGAIGTNPPQIGNLMLRSSITGSGIKDLISVPLTDTEYDSTMITAFYKDGVFVDMQTTPIKAGDELEEIPVTDKNADMAKVMIWSSMDSMKPLCEEKEIDINL